MKKQGVLAWIKPLSSMHDLYAPPPAVMKNPRDAGPTLLVDTVDVPPCISVPVGWRRTYKEGCLGAFFIAVSRVVRLVRRGKA